MELLLNQHQRLYATMLIVDACNPDNTPGSGFAFPMSMPDNVAGMASHTPD